MAVNYFTRFVFLFPNNYNSPKAVTPSTWTEIRNWVVQFIEETFDKVGEWIDRRISYQQQSCEGLWQIVPNI